MAAKLLYVYTAYVENAKGSALSGNLDAEAWLASELTKNNIDSFTLTEATGYYRKQRERSLCIDVVQSPDDHTLLERFEFVLSIFCRVFDQQSALVTRTVCTVYDCGKDGFG